MHMKLKNYSILHILFISFYIFYAFYLFYDIYQQDGGNDSSHDTIFELTLPSISLLLTILFIKYRLRKIILVIILLVTVAFHLAVIYLVFLILNTSEEIMSEFSSIIIAFTGIGLTIATLLHLIFIKPSIKTSAYII